MKRSISQLRNRLRLPGTGINHSVVVWSRPCTLAMPRFYAAVARASFLALMILVVLAPSTNPVCAQGRGVISREYPLKALYLYHFGRYVKWPVNAKAPKNQFVIGVVGSSPITRSLVTLGQKKSLPGGRPIKVVADLNPADAGGCHIVYVSKLASPGTLRLLRDQFAKTPVLVVGETPGFAKQGGMINLALRGNKLEFEIRPTACQNAGLAPSAKLVKLGKVVRGN